MQRCISVEIQAARCVNRRRPTQSLIKTVPLGGAKALSNLVHGDLMMPGLAWPASITDAALERVQGILTPRQISALRELQAQRAANYQLAPPAAKGAPPEEALALYRNSKPPN